MERVTLGLLKEFYLFLVFLRDECVKRTHSTPSLEKRTAKRLEVSKQIEELLTMVTVRWW